MSTDGFLNFRNTKRATFVGPTSNISFDTVNSSLGIGVTGPDPPSSNLYITGNAYVTSDFSLGGVLKMGTVNVVARHTLEAITATGNTSPFTMELTNTDTSLVASGNVEVGTANLFVDTVNSRVGIGTNVPDATLHVTGNAHVSSNVEVGTANLYVNTTNSRVGVGTMNPSRTLHIYAPSTESSVPLLVQSEDQFCGMFLVDDAGSVQLQNNRGALRFLVDGDENLADQNEVLRITNDGRFGFGTTSPGKKLEIAHGYQSLGGYIDTYRVSGVVGGTVLGTRQGGGTHLDAIHITDSAWIGIGLNNPGIITTAPNVNRTVHVVGRYVVSEPGDDEHWSISTNNHLDFKRSINGTGYIDAARVNYSTGGYDDLITFTGQHRGVHIENIPPKDAYSYEGLIVCANCDEYESVNGVKRRGNEAITVNEAVPLLRLSCKENDKTCFGVISDSEESDTRTQTFGNFKSFHHKMKGDEQIFINSLGEGGIWVVNTNGSFESGDYITTSNVPGYGMKQNDDVLHNYTVAKITMNCDFNPISQPKKRLVKREELVVYYLDENNNITTEEKAQSTREVMEYVNVLDEREQMMWEDHPTETEKAYKIRYLDADGNITDEANAVHTAAFVGCTYHCG